MEKKLLLLYFLKKKKKVQSKNKQTIVALNNCQLSPSTLNNSQDCHVTTLGEMVPSGDSSNVTSGLQSTLNNNWHMKGVYLSVNIWNHLVGGCEPLGSSPLPAAAPPPAGSPQ